MRSRILIGTLVVLGTGLLLLLVRDLRSTTLVSAPTQSTPSANPAPVVLPRARGLPERASSRTVTQSAAADEDPDGSNEVTDSQERPATTTEAIARERDKVHSALSSSGAPSEWTTRAPAAFEQWIASVPPPLRSALTTSTPECYEAGCIMSVAFAGDPDDMVHALDRFSGWDKWMILGVDTQDPHSSKTAIVLFNPDKPVPL